MAQVTIGTNTLIAPMWAADGLGADSLIPGGARLDASQFTAIDAVVVTVGAAGAAQNATSVPVAALSGPVPSGTVLYFGGAKVAQTTAAAAAGATSVTVAALPTALVQNDVATYAGMGLKTIKAGTLIGRTFTERGNSVGFGPAVVASDDEIYLLAFDVADAAKNPDCELYRPGRLVKENYLPNWANLGSTVQAKIRALYQCITGTN